MTRRAEQQARLDRVDVSQGIGAALNARLRVRDGRLGRDVIRAELVVDLPDVISGRVYPYTWPFDVRADASDEQIGRTVLDAMMCRLIHEARECVRLRAPHDHAGPVDDPHVPTARAVVIGWTAPAAPWRER